MLHRICYNIVNTNSWPCIFGLSGVPICYLNYSIGVFSRCCLPNKWYQCPFRMEWDMPPLFTVRVGKGNVCLEPTQVCITQDFPTKIILKKKTQQNGIYKKRDAREIPINIHECVGFPWIDEHACLTCDSYR